MKAKTFRLFISAIMLTLSFGANARVYLVSVGIADYSGFPSKINNLRLTTKDAETIVDLYSKNTSVDYSLLLNEKATKDRIVRAIKKVFNQASEDDLVVFFFSGHGYPGGFCAYDGNMGYDEVRKAMAKSKSKNKMMFVDACRSGGLRVDETGAQGAITAAKNANVMLFLSSRNNENSIERRDMQNGFFTTYLQKGLKGNADANRNRIITAKELFDFVHLGVSQISGGKQHPVMWGNFNDNMTVMKW
ncbi:MAG: caspase family protein [Bacteroides sp.]|nr:caspase family protein [Bacteroides sp.]MBD5305954.1 caspase family protein [Bacteroides sp.]